MPSPASSVGNIAIPVTVGATDDPIVDTTVTGLLGYLQFWTQYALNPKLATMTAPPVPDACPSANCYPVNVSSLVARFNKPALFLWWDGKSVTVPWTSIIDLRQRDLAAFWVFDRVVDIDALTRYAGLTSALDAAWTRAVSKRAHPGYAPPGCRLGTALYIALGLHELTYLGGQPGILQEQATTSARAAAVQTGPPRFSKGTSIGIVSGYPCLKATFRVLEQVGPDTALPSDATPDLRVVTSLGGTGDPAHALAMPNRIVPAPPYPKTT
jgi:hypothetical protein